MGPLPQTENGNMYILVLADYFSKWAEAYALKDHTAPTVADVLVKQFVSRFGVPRSLHSDQGREFKSDLIAHLCKLLHIHKTRTVPFNPKSDGLVERDNRTIKQMLTTMVNEVRNDWDDHLPYIMMAYRASVHEVTLLMLNHETNLPIDLMIGAPPETPVCPVHYVQWVREAFEHAFQFVQNNLKTSAEWQKKLYDWKSGFPKFVVGSSVWRYYPPRGRLKFGKGWEGPYLVKGSGKVTPLSYRIQKTQNSRSILVHVDHLKSYEGEKPVNSWLTEGNQEQRASSSDGEQDEDDCQSAAAASAVVPSCSLDESVGNETSTPDDAGQVKESKSDAQSLPVISRDTETFPNTDQANKQTDIDSTAEPAPNLPTDLNSDLDKTYPDGSQQLVDAPHLPTNLNSDLDKAPPDGSQQLVDAPCLPDNPNSDLDNTLPYGSQQFVDASEPVISTCPSPTNLASSEPSNPDDDLALPIAIRRTQRPRKPRDILDL